MPAATATARRPTPTKTTAPHSWVAAATVPLTDRQARLALLRGSIRLPGRAKIEVLDAYCALCKRPFEDCVGEPCSALVNNEHLRGGPIGVRKKRAKKPKPAADLELVTPDPGH